MTIYDISIPLRRDMPVWPGDPAFESQPIAVIGPGSHANVSHLHMASHTGTHIDPPFHFLADGGTMDDVPLEMLIGPADVVAFKDVTAIDAKALAQAAIPADCQRLLFKTTNSGYWQRRENQFHRDYIGLLPDGAQWLVERGIGLVGADYLGVHRFDSAVPVHHTLLGAGIVIVEGLNLYEIEPGRYQFVCLPLKLEGGDGAPARAVLID